MIAITHIYENISFERIAKILGLSIEKILKILHVMVNEKRISARID